MGAVTAIVLIFAPVTPPQKQASSKSGKVHVRPSRNRRAASQALKLRMANTANGHGDGSVPVAK